MVPPSRSTYRATNGPQAAMRNLLVSHWWPHGAMDHAAAAYAAARDEADQRGVAGERATSQAQSALVLAFTDPELAEDELTLSEQLLTGRADIRTAGEMYAELTLDLALAFHHAVRGADSDVTATIDRLREGTRGGYAEEDFSEGATAVVLGQCGGVAPDVGGHGAGVPDELEGDLLVVAGFEVGVLPREHSGDECLVRGAVQREFGFDQAVGVVEHGVRVTHRRPAASSWSWSPGLASGAWTARKRA